MFPNSFLPSSNRIFNFLVSHSLDGWDGLVWYGSVFTCRLVWYGILFYVSYIYKNVYFVDKVFFTLK
jgi:hypothetical protein